MDKKQLRSSLLLLLGAVIWGSAFVAQSVGMDYIGPFTFNAVRSLIGTVSLLPLILILNRRKKKSGSSPAKRKEYIKACLVCGLVLFGATMCQQIGLQYTTVGKAGFITAMYIVLVPVLGVFLGRRPALRIWFCVLLACVGLYFLCINEGFSIEKGDLMMLGSAVLFAFQILAIAHFAPKVDSLKLSAGQFFVSGMVSLVCMFILETPKLPQIFAAWLPLLYAGVLSSGVAYTLQIIGEKDADPAIASLAMSMESVFSVLAGWVILGQVLSPREWIGCGLMFSAILISHTHA